MRGSQQNSCIRSGSKGDKYTHSFISTLPNHKGNQMAAHLKSFSMHKQNLSWSAFRWLLLMITFGLLSGCSTSGSVGGLTIPEAYQEGLKKEAAKDYNGAIAYYTEAIDNFARFPGWLAKATVKQAMDPNKVTDDMIANPEKIWLPHKAFLHRAQSKRALGDTAGEKADLALYEKQRVEDKEILGDLMNEETSQKAQAAQDAADAKASAEADAKSKATGCVGQGYGGLVNNCKRTVRFEARIALNRCSGAGIHELRPNEMFKVSSDCTAYVSAWNERYIDR